jgi:N-acetyl-gamma-glutamyl-phosphate reductase
VQVLNGLPKHVKVVDLSADFRLRSIDTYAQWYGGEHKAPDLQKEAIYGLTELHREAVVGARLVANPGCYPTCAQLPLVPLLQGGHILKEGITIDAKSGVSGAGRAVKEAMLFCEVADGMHAYGVSSHRHMPEIEQGLSEAVGGEGVTVSFTPHLVPMSRGMLATMYVQLGDGRSADDLRWALSEAYTGEFFVRYAASFL